MLKHYNILKKIQEAKAKGFRCFTERHLEEQWVSFYDLLRKSGTYSNLPHIFNQIKKHIPEIAACCVRLQLPGKGQHNTPAFPMTHLDYLEEVFTILSRHFPRGQTFREKPVAQYNIPLSGEATDPPVLCALPKPPPLPPLPKEPGEFSAPKKEKSRVREVSAHYDTSEQPRLGPFGWLRYSSGRLEPYKKEHRSMLNILLMSARGNKLPEIASFLNQKNILYRGETWTTKDIQSVLHSFNSTLDEWEKQKLDGTSGRSITTHETEVGAPPIPAQGSSAS